MIAVAKPIALNRAAVPLTTRPSMAGVRRALTIVRASEEPSPEVEKEAEAAPQMAEQVCIAFAVPALNCGHGM